MAQQYTWDDADELAEVLAAAYPDTDPLSVGFARLHQMIVDLPEFTDAPEAATERRLEQIQMAWYDLVEE